MADGDSPASDFPRPFNKTIAEFMENSKVEHNHYAAIGRVACAWSLFEAGVDTASIMLAGLDAKPGVCLTSQIAGIGRKLDAYIALARLQPLPKKLIERLDNFAKDANGLAERRNRILHDVWFFNHPNRPERLEATARKLLRLDYFPTSTDEINKLASDINTLHGKFDILDQAVKTWPETLPETPPPTPLL